jgi:hypothetical protein
MHSRTSAALQSSRFEFFPVTFWKVPFGTVSETFN